MRLTVPLENFQFVDNPRIIAVTKQEREWRGGLESRGEVIIATLCGEGTSQVTITSGSTTGSDNSLKTSGAAYTLFRQ